MKDLAAIAAFAVAVGGLTLSLVSPSAAKLTAHTNYLFHNPFESTPVFLLNLGKAVQGSKLNTKTHDAYMWPGGVGAGKSIVAYSAICAHQLVYPSKDVSFISFRKGAAVHAKTPSVGDDLIHCCADHSQYDPAQGAKVLAGLTCFMPP